MTDRQALSRDQAVASEDLGLLFRRASKMMARASHRHDHAHHAQAYLFQLIQERGPINQRELMKILDLRSSSLSELLAKLEQHGLIVRKRDDKDRRSFIVSVREGVDSPFADQENAGRPDKSEIFFAALDEEEREQLTVLLSKIIASMEESGLQAGCGQRHQQRHLAKHGRCHAGRSGHGKRRKQ